jgi:hypothetical protein
MSNHLTAEFVDYRGQKIKMDWSENVWRGHLKKHPQLIDRKNCSDMIESTVKKPHVVMEGSRPGNSETNAIYYQELRRYQHFITYSKVVCCIRNKNLYVKTVYEETAPLDLVIQEKKYPQNFKEIWRTETNIL